MPERRVNIEMLEGISVEYLDLESIEVTPTTAETDWSRQRKTAPFDGLLASTLRWAEDLPPQVRPRSLMDKFPRIANLVAANWKEPVAFRNYMQSLLADQRRGRRGFSSDIKEELDTLRMFYYFGRCLRTTGANGVGSPVSARAEAVPPSSAHASPPDRSNSKH